MSGRKRCISALSNVSNNSLVSDTIDISEEEEWKINQAHQHHALLVTNQSKLDVRGKVVKPFKFDVNSAHKAFIEFLVCNNHAFTLGEEPAFRKFISLLQPLYRPLGATAVKDRLMQMNVRLRQQLISRISNANVALTTDMWTSPNNFAFMGITVALLDDKFKPHDLIIGFQHVMRNHSGLSLAESFYEVIKLYQ